MLAVGWETTTLPRGLEPCGLKAGRIWCQNAFSQIVLVSSKLLWWRTDLFPAIQTLSELQISFRFA